MDFTALPTPSFSGSPARQRAGAALLALMLAGMLAACEPDTALPQPLPSATTGMDGSDSGDSGDTGDTGDSGDSGDTGDTGDTGDRH